MWPLLAHLQKCLGCLAVACLLGRLLLHTLVKMHLSLLVQLRLHLPGSLHLHTPATLRQHTRLKLDWMRVLQLRVVARM